MSIEQYIARVQIRLSIEDLHEVRKTYGVATRRKIEVFFWIFGYMKCPPYTTADLEANYQCR